MNISEIAKLAGVSNAAVSRYLNHGYLSAEKREAIGRVIRETGYRPLAQAQTLRTRRTRTVGVILPKINSFTISSVVAGIDGVLAREGFRLLLANTHNSPEKELEYLELFNEQLVDGVILIATVFTPEHLAFLERCRVPVSIAGQRLEGTPCVYHDDYHAFYDMTRTVIGRGCRRLGYIGALPQDQAIGRARSCAYRDAVLDAGLAGQEEHTAVAGLSIGSGREKAGELLDRFGPLDALICATDVMAVGALQLLQSRSIRVPEQTMVTGQGASELSQVTTPAITTIRYQYEESGAHAAALLLERLADPAAPAREICLGYTIVESGSTGPRQGT